MKQIIVIFLTMVLVLPLYAQNAESEEQLHEEAGAIEAAEPVRQVEPVRQAEPVREAEPARETAAVEEVEEDAPVVHIAQEEQEIEAEEDALGIAVSHQPGRDPSEKKPYNYARQSVEFGIDANLGLDNDLLTMSEIFAKNLVLDFDKMHDNGRPSGMNINFDLLTRIYLNVRLQESWGFGFYTGMDGAMYGKLPKNLITLMAEGNVNEHYFSDFVSASGGLFANLGINGFVRFGEGNKWRIGFSPSMYTPIIYVLGKPGLSYTLDTTNGIKLSSGGAIDIYTPFSFDPHSSNFDSVLGSPGFDLSLEVEAALYPYLDVGASLTRIPLVAGELKHHMQYKLHDDFRIDADVEDLRDGNGISIPDYRTNITYNPNKNFKVYRPLRFDIYTLCRPLPSMSKVLTLKTNMGFTVDITGETSYFNIGFEIQSMLLQNMIFLYLGSGCDESIWVNRFGFAINLRAFELDLEGSLRSQSFSKSFQGMGYGANVGLRFGW